MASHAPRTDYSAADIERYYNGAMPAAERHALEKAALDDPFLSDALEGYVHTKTPAADVAFLKQQLQKKQPKVVPITWKGNRSYLKVAALFVLLAGFGWLAYRLTSNHSDIAFLQKHTSKEKQAAPAQETADSIATAPEAKPTTGDQSATMRTDGKKPQVPERKERNRAASTQAPVDSNPAAADQTFSKAHADAPLPQEKSRMLTARRVPDVFKARVVDPNNKAVPYALITNQQNKAIATTDTAGAFLVTSPDSTLSIAINSVGFQPQRALLNPAPAETTIVLQPASGALNEVVVTAKNKKQTARNIIKLEAAAPRDGWQKLDRYLETNELHTEEINKGETSSDVVLSFDVADDGTAVNITIEKPLCASCDSSAVQLVQNATKWKKTKKAGKAKAHIRF